MKSMHFALLLFCCSLYSFATAQQPLNFDFEKKSVEGFARPWGWSPFQIEPNTSSTLDSVTKHEGKFSLRFSNQNNSDNGSDSDHTMGYWLSPHELSGKKLALSGWVKTEKSGGRMDSRDLFREMNLINDAILTFAKEL